MKGFLFFFFLQISIVVQSHAFATPLCALVYRLIWQLQRKDKISFTLLAFRKHAKELSYRTRASHGPGLNRLEICIYNSIFKEFLCMMLFSSIQRLKCVAFDFIRRRFLSLPHSCRCLDMGAMMLLLLLVLVIAIHSFPPFIVVKQRSAMV